VGEVVVAPKKNEVEIKPKNDFLSQKKPKNDFHPQSFLRGYVTDLQ